MSYQLFELNSLEKIKSVWINPQDKGDFGYSDGTDEEQYLIDLLSSVSDLSVDSPALVWAIQDWPSEYHLSSLRANLLKNIVIPSTANILEVGCGCGAITRYLGEQGYEIHALEGSLERAKIARLRTRDLDNVEIIKHNFNSLVLPEKSYDVILFIGVLEYAKRFSGENNLTSEQAVINLLDRASAALNNDGYIIVAIENRTGHKYQKGALEDHLAKPYVGIENYYGYEFTGIKTYDYSQWNQIISKCNLNSEFFYPFPDYKLPTLVINNPIINNQDNFQTMAYLASQIHSIDPISDWTMPQPESRQWADALTQDKLAESANSFGLVLAKSKTTLVDIFKNEWSLCDSNFIVSESRLDLSSTSSNLVMYNNGLWRKYNKIDEIEESLLNIWLTSFSEFPDLKILAKLSNDIYTLILKQWPSTILVDIDQFFMTANKQSVLQAKYWQFNSEISAEFQLFHVLFDFCVKQRKTLAKSDTTNLMCIEEIIDYCFAELDVDYQYTKSGLIRDEQNLRDRAFIKPKTVKGDLKTLISNYDRTNFSYVNSQVFWANQTNTFNATNSKTVRGKQTSNLMTLIFENLEASCPYLRFDPCDHEHGNGHLFAINSLLARDEKGDTIGEIDLTDNISLVDLTPITPAKAIYKVDGNDPQIIFSLPLDLKNVLTRYNLEIQLQWLGK